MNPLLAFQLAGMAIQGIQGFAAQRAQNEQARAQMKAAFQAAGWDMAALQDRATQIDDAAQLEMFERQRQALRERSKILTAAGEAGVSGSSVLRQLNQSLFDESFDIGIYKTRRRDALIQTNLDAQNVVNTAYSRAQQAASGIQSPWIQPLLIGGATYAGYKLGGGMGG